MKIKLFKSLILPHFIYCDFLFSNATASALNRLRVALNACVRYVFNLTRYSHVSHLQDVLLGCQFSKFYSFRACLQVYIIIKRKTPRYLYDKLQFMRNTRTMSLVIPNHSSAYYGQSLFVRGINNWNRLSPTLKQALFCSSWSDRWSDLVRSQQLWVSIRCWLNNPWLREWRETLALSKRTSSIWQL